MHLHMYVCNKKVFLTTLIIRLKNLETPSCLKTFLAKRLKQK